MSCEISHFKIPLIYGDEELNYTFLLNHLYFNVIYKKDEPKEENILGKANKYSEEEKNLLFIPKIH